MMFKKPLSFFFLADFPYLHFLKARYVRDTKGPLDLEANRYCTVKKNICTNRQKSGNIQNNEIPRQLQNTRSCVCLNTLPVH